MNAKRIAALFLAFGIAWILVSDHVLEVLVSDQHVRADVQSFKGVVFVLLSAMLVYWLVRAAERKHQALEASALAQSP